MADESTVNISCTKVSQMEKTLNIFHLIISWKQKVHNDFIFLCSLHCVPYKCSSTSEVHGNLYEKIISTESVATRAPLAAPLHWTWKTCLPSPLWAVQRHESHWGQGVANMQWMWKTLKGQIFDCCNSWMGNMGSSIVMLEQNTCTLASTSFGLDYRTQVIL